MVTMARYGRKRRGGRRAKSIPVAVALPVALAGVQAGQYAMKGEWTNAQYIFTGVDSTGNFQSSRVIKTYAPIAAGVIVHKVANKVGVNNFVRRVSMGYLSI